MTTPPHKLLLIEDDAIDMEVVHRYISIAGDGEFHVTVEQSLRSATARLEHETFALILMDQRLPDSIEDQTFTTIRDSAAHTPIVVLTGLGDEREGAKMIRMGAQDYLVKGRFDAFLLVRVVRYAIERWALLHEVEALRLREKQNQEFQALEEYSRTIEGQKNPRALKDAAPAYFKDLVARYGQLLDAAMQRRIYKSEGQEVQEGIRALTRELSRIKAGPREIVEIHSFSLQQKLNQPTEIKNQVYLEEGRLLLLETMGAMVKEYRGTKEVNYEPIRDENSQRHPRV